MAHRTTYTAARANFATLCDKAADDREVIIISRRNSGDVALVAAKELSSLLETAHLLRSPKNAKRLLSALNRATARKGKAQSLDKLRREMGLDSKT
ncbi:MAG: type II toxin-antitoxin system prevent-host-death family antitoxin [Acidobacteriota bacterium]|nr:type II toxin-antitoxin system prevent-host-death family antitoxin [Acidobacteriota bacterium]